MLGKIKVTEKENNKVELVFSSTRTLKENIYDILTTAHDYMSHSPIVEVQCNTLVFKHTDMVDVSEVLYRWNNEFIDAISDQFDYYGQKSYTIDLDVQTSKS